MNEKVIDSFREVLGQYLTNTMKEKGLNIYKLEKITSLPGLQINTVLSGKKNYTIDTLAKVLQALDLYVFFAPKEGEHLNFDHMNEKLNENDPKL